LTFERMDACHGWSGIDRLRVPARNPATGDGGSHRSATPAQWCDAGRDRASARPSLVASSKSVRCGLAPTPPYRALLEELMKRTFKQADFCEIAWDHEVISRDNWRHGTRNTIVFEHEGKHWRTTI